MPQKLLADESEFSEESDPDSLIQDTGGVAVGRLSGLCGGTLQPIITRQSQPHQANANCEQQASQKAMNY